ncbi:hypothetical protein NDU88_002012 [Pleurodeles waltl]|uniref:Uncharacterized protein n=1 Tax=Pleurodeles waltl TaxID=8319 RepID=A0AAV7T1C2_PLEWA|nr:hypothetical protein NDU88_002012 [Pleurodeles waltl]
MCGVHRSWCRQLRRCSGSAVICRPKPAVREGTEIRDPHEWCPQDTVQARMAGDDTGSDGAGVGGPGLRHGTGRCFVLLTSGVHRPRCKQWRRCRQERRRWGCL